MRATSESRDISVADGIAAISMSLLVILGVPAAMGALVSDIAMDSEIIPLSAGNSSIAISSGIGGSNDLSDGIKMVRASDSGQEQDNGKSDDASVTPADDYHYAIETVPVYEPPVQDVLVPVEEIQEAEVEYEDRDYSWVDYSVFASLSTQGKIKLLGAMAQEDQRRSGVLASVTMAQCILESGWMRSGLTKQAENYFGIKSCSLENNFANSHWYGRTVEMETSEEYVEGELVKITASFRAYDNAWQSMMDHSAYLVNSQNGSKPRYPAIAYIRDYRQAVQLIKDGGYATSAEYVDSVCRVIERYELYNWDLEDGATPEMAEATIGTGDGQD